MRRYLVVANQTLGGDALREEISKKVTEGPSFFHVVVPNTPPKDLSARLAAPAGDTSRIVGGGIPVGETVADAAATDAARKRLASVLSEIRSAGADADGELGDPDPLDAIQEVLAAGEFDEIIVSTLPSGVSKWLRMDVPSRVERRFALPVTTIISGA